MQVETILSYHYTARSNINSSKEWLYEALNSNDDTKDMVDITKYFLYKATGADYGVENYDFSVYDPENFMSLEKQLEGTTNEEKIWFVLRSAGFSEYATAALMGNLSIESNLRTNNLEDAYETRISLKEKK